MGPDYICLVLGHNGDSHSLFAHRSGVAYQFRFDDRQQKNLLLIRQKSSMVRKTRGKYLLRVFLLGRVIIRI